MLIILEMVVTVDNNLGKHLSEETKRKIGDRKRINMTGRKATIETKKKMSEVSKKTF